MISRWRLVCAAFCLISGFSFCLLSFNAPNEKIAMYARPGLLFFVIAVVLMRSIFRRQNSEEITIDWYEVTGKYHKRTYADDDDAPLSSLPEIWQRELAALWRLEADVNNGAYLQFLTNWGRESYVYASQALKKIGAQRTAQIIDQCQALVDEHYDLDKRSPDEHIQLLPNPVIGRDGVMHKEAGSSLPGDVLARIHELSYEFMEYPDDIARLGITHYRTRIEADENDRNR